MNGRNFCAVISDTPMDDVLQQSSPREWFYQNHYSPRFWLHIEVKTAIHVEVKTAMNIAKTLFPCIQIAGSESFDHFYDLHLDDCSRFLQFLDSQPGSEEEYLESFSVSWLPNGDLLFEDNYSANESDIIPAIAVPIFAESMKEAIAVLREFEDTLDTCIHKAVARNVVEIRSGDWNPHLRDSGNFDLFDVEQLMPPMGKLMPPPKPMPQLPRKKPSPLRAIANGFRRLFK